MTKDDVNTPSSSLQREDSSEESADSSNRIIPSIGVAVPSIQDIPLHSGVIHSWEWFACNHPERPADENTAYDVRCRACLIAAQAEVVTNGDKTVYKNNGDNAPISLSGFLRDLGMYTDE